MDLAKRLADELTELRQKVGKAESQDQFNDHYERLLRMLTATMQAMRASGVQQGGWLQGQAQQQGRMN